MAPSPAQRERAGVRVVAREPLTPTLSRWEREQDGGTCMFDWMVWTQPVAVFFSCIGLMLAGMTLWEIKQPTVLRKGFLPIATTRGDRLFIGLLTAAYINLAFIGSAGAIGGWLGLDQEPSIWISLGISMIVLGLIMRKG
jgi:predicted small integral membrane protein